MNNFIGLGMLRLAIPILVAVASGMKARTNYDKNITPPHVRNMNTYTSTHSHVDI